jgi:16S rRNA (guanine527-N7)-methyltransferase
MDSIKKYFPNLTEQQLQQFAALFNLYKDLNAQINVISKKDIDNLYVHHILHSLSIAKAIQFGADDLVLDAGTGGGFPGIPLAIMFPQTKFVLADSIGKKIRVVDVVAETLGLKNVTTQCSRLEDLSGQFDFIVSRAVTRLDVMWGWVARLIKTNGENQLPNGLLYLKGGNINQELPGGVAIKRWDINQFFAEPYFNEKALVLLCKQREN